MKKLIFLTILSLTIFVSCENEEILRTSDIESIDSNIPELHVLKNSAELENLVNKTISQYGRASKGNSLLKDVDFETAIKRYDEQSGISYYTFPMEWNESTVRQFLLKQNTSGEILGHVIELESEGKLEQNEPMEYFTGWFRILNLNGSVTTETWMGARQGKSLKTGSTASKSACSSSFTDWYNCRGDVISSSACDYSHTSVTTSCSSSGGASWNEPLNNGAQNDEYWLFTSSFGNTGSATSGGYYPINGAESFEYQIDDTQLKPCLKNVLNDLKNLNNGVGPIIAKFAGKNPGFNWEVKDGSLDGPTGSTDPPANYNHFTGTLTTTFDSQAYLQATDLSWARTILHESVHAYLAVEFKINQPNWIATYPQMVAEWGRLQNWNAVHHEEFARSIVNEIALALEEYGRNQGYNLSSTFYQDMAWGGLQSTSTFSAMPTSAKNRILNVIVVELTGQDLNASPKTQKGTNAGC